jgi:hypothetical protein
MDGIFREPDVFKVVGVLLIKGIGIFGPGRGDGDDHRS